jgi:hypothetical protein
LQKALVDLDDMPQRSVSARPQEKLAGRKAYVGCPERRAASLMSSFQQDYDMSARAQHASHRKTSYRCDDASGEKLRELEPDEPTLLQFAPPLSTCRRDQ